MPCAPCRGGGGSGGQIGLEMLVQKVSTSHEAPVLRSTMPGGDAEAMATLVMAYGYAVCSIYDIRHYETVRISGTIESRAQES